MEKKGETSYKSHPRKHEVCPTIVGVREMVAFRKRPETLFARGGGVLGDRINSFGNNNNKNKNNKKGGIGEFSNALTGRVDVGKGGSSGGGGEASGGGVARGAAGGRADEERDGSLVKEEGPGPELKEDLGAGLPGGVVGSHEILPGGGRSKRMDEAGVRGVAKPGPPRAARVETPRQLVAPPILPQKLPWLQGGGRRRRRRRHR